MDTEVAGYCLHCGVREALDTEDVCYCWQWYIRVPNLQGVVCIVEYMLVPGALFSLWSGVWINIPDSPGISQDPPLVPTIRETYFSNLRIIAIHFIHTYMAIQPQKLKENISQVCAPHTRIYCIFQHLFRAWYRRRIKTEEKVKAVAAEWGTELIQFLAALAIFCTRMISKICWVHPILHIVLVQLILLFKSSWCKIASAAKKLIDSAPQTAATTFAFSSVFILFLWW